MKARALLKFGRRYPYRFLKMATSRLEVSHYRRKHSKLLLNVGAQTNRPKGWLNVDVFPTFGTVYLDATKLSALGPSSFDAVLCEHMIEHVPKDTARAILREIHRILKPGGVARFVTPDIERMCALILHPGVEEKRYLDLIRVHLRRPEISYIDAANIMFRDYGHQYIYGRDELTLLLRAAGFESITITTASGFADPIFEHAQGHPRVLGEELNNLEAFGLEAQR